MAAKAGFIFERRVDLIGGGVLRPRERCPKTGNGDEKKQAGENPRRAPYNERPKAQIPEFQVAGFQVPGFDLFERVVHDVPIPADRSQAGSFQREDAVVGEAIRSAIRCDWPSRVAQKSFMSLLNFP
jgi:hypothetical protein